MQQTYRQLGLLEMADQRAGAKDLASKVELVNSGRVAIWVTFLFFFFFLSPLPFSLLLLGFTNEVVN
jgi:hypothetical protein